MRIPVVFDAGFRVGRVGASPDDRVVDRVRSATKSDRSEYRLSRHRASGSGVPRTVWTDESARTVDHEPGSLVRPMSGLLGIQARGWKMRIFFGFAALVFVIACEDGANDPDPGRRFTVRHRPAGARGHVHAVPPPERRIRPVTAPLLGEA